jgi:hypothetical protein
LFVARHNLIYLSFCVGDAKEIVRRFPGSREGIVNP